MCISISSNGYTGIFYMMISHSAEYTILFIQFMSIETSIYHTHTKKTRLVSGGEGVINVDRVVINMSLCLETEIKMPILFLIIYEGAM